MSSCKINPSEVVSALQKALSPDVQVLKEGEDKLLKYEKVPGYHALLLSLLKNPELHPHIQLLTVVMFKNGIERNWRQVIKEDEKGIIRREIFAATRVPIFQLAVQLATVIGKIVRSDIKQWPGIITSVLEAVKSPDPFIQHRSLLVLNHIIKALASKRLVSDRMLFKQISEQIFNYNLEILVANTNAFLSTADNHDAAGVSETLELCILATKVLKKLLIQGFKEYGKDSGAMMFLHFILHNLRPVLKKRPVLHHPHDKERIDKFTVLLAKVLLESQENQPLSFVPVLEDALLVAMEVVFSDQLNACSLDLMKVKCCNLIQKIIRCELYRPKRGVEPDDGGGDSVYMEAFKIRRKLFTFANLQECVRRLSFQYFPLKQEDIELWENDPEAFVSEDIGESISYMLKPSAESLFLSLFYEFRDSVTHAISDLLRPINAAGRTDPDNFSELVEREAVYHAVGLASYELFEELNFDEWFTEHLMKEFQLSDPRLKFVKYRITWVIGRWINVKFSRENRIRLYSLLGSLLGQSEDIVVRITAARTLKAAVEDFEFRSDDFIQFLGEIFQRLINLLIETQECDTKLSILQVISVVTEKVGKKVQPHCRALVTYLPQVWTESTDHKMLQSAIVSTFCCLVESFGDQSEELQSLLVPVIRLGTDMQQEAHVHLMDETLELWHALLKNAVRMTNHLLQLYTAMIPLLDRASQNLRICIGITESYILLDAQPFLQVYSKNFVGMLDNLLGALKMEGNIILARLIELVLVLFPVEGATLFKDLLVRILEIVLEDEEYPPLMAVYLSLFAYLITQNMEAYIAVASAYSSLHEQSIDETTATLLDVWLDKVDSMTKEDRRKLTAIAMCSLLPSNNRIVNDRFALILDMVVNVIYDAAKILKSEDSRSGPEETDPFEEELLSNLTPEEKREAMVRRRDPILSTDLTTYVRVKLHDAQISLGSDLFKERMETLDPVVAKQLMTCITTMK